VELFLPIQTLTLQQTHSFLMVVWVSENLYCTVESSVVLLNLSKNDNDIIAVSIFKKKRHRE